MKKLLSVILSLFLTTLSFAQETKNSSDNIAIIKTFIHELANENKSVDVVLSQQVIVENPSEELYDYLEVSLEGIRINLIAKKLEEIEYIPYNKMPRKDVRDIDPEGLNTDSMYFLMYKNRQMLAVYVENGKIGSFTLVSKGNNKAHFVLY